MAQWSRISNAEAPWGDYGRILVSGMTSRRADSGALPYERVGPFMPPITIAGISDLLVSDGFRLQLESSDLHGLQFRKVELQRVVRLDWRAWDLDADDPAKYPAGDEPENYISGRKHDPVLADDLGPVWEVVIETTADSPDGCDVVRSAPTPFSRLLASDTATEWLAANAADWIALQPQA